MALLEIDLQPSARQLQWFGLLLFIFFSLLGAIAFFIFDAHGVAYVLWGLASVLAIVYYTIKPFRRPLYMGWMYAVWPIGWTISHLLLASIYFLLITPIGWTMRILGRDPMQRKLDSEAETYWFDRRRADHVGQYFRQF